MLNRMTLLLVTLIALQGCGLSGEEADAQTTASSEEQGIVSGTLLTLEQTQAAGLVGLLAQEQNTDRTGFCSGTLVSDRLVLTAAHCRATRKGPVKFAVFGTDIFNAPRHVVAIEKMVAHPMQDVALVLLAQPAPAAWVRQPLGTARRYGVAGLKVVAQGFGRMTSSNPNSGGYAQTANAIATFYEPSASIFTVTTRSPIGLCNGDSGGPAKATAILGGQAVIGVLSTGNPGCGGVDTFINTLPLDRWLRTESTNMGQALLFAAW